MAQRVFPFLQLPTEIRILIYRLVLPYSGYDVKRENVDSPIVWFRGKCPSILFANRQIHQEATEVLYRENTFAVYVRHPRDPRLPMNAGHADPETFMLISWAQTTWSNPRNPMLPLSILKHHQNLHNIRHVHVSLPPSDDLLGIDVYMQKSSYAAFNGINAWIRKCAKAGGSMDETERERIDYVQQIKEPIDEVGNWLQTLTRIDNLYISLQAREREIVFAEFMLEQILALKTVKRVHAFYVPRHFGPRRRIWGNPDPHLLQLLEKRLEDPVGSKKDSFLPKDMDAMFWVLQAIRSRQQLDLATLPDWLLAMPE